MRLGPGIQRYGLITWNGSLKSHLFWQIYRQAARAAYGRGLLASQASVVNLGRVANDTTSLNELHSDSTSRGLFSLLERYTQLSTFDLLAPETVSLRHVFAGLEDGDAEVSGVASLVEYQHHYLASSPASRSSAARAAMKYLISDAIVFYQADRFPIRRARYVPRHEVGRTYTEPGPLRALVRQLEQTFFDDDQVIALQITDEIHAILCDRSSSDEALEMPSALYESVSSTQDKNLLALCPALIAITNLWLALIVYRTAPADAVASEFHCLLSRALQVLKDNYLSRSSYIGTEVMSSALVEAKAAQLVLSDKQNFAKKRGRAAHKAKAATKGIAQNSIPKSLTSCSTCWPQQLL